MNLVPTLTLLISIAINFVILNYMNNVEQSKCVCAKACEVAPIKNLIYLNIATISFNTLIVLFNVKNVNILMLSGLLGMISIFYAPYLYYLLITYLSNLKNINCSCAINQQYTFIYVYTIISVVFYAIGLLMLFKVINTGVPQFMKQFK